MGSLVVTVISGLSCMVMWLTHKSCMGNCIIVVLMVNSLALRRQVMARVPVIQVHIHIWSGQGERRMHPAVLSTQ